MKDHSYILAVTGASAQPLAERCLRILLLNNIDVHLIISKGAHKVWQAEMNISIPVDVNLQHNFWRNRLKLDNANLNCYKWDNHAACIASGSYKTNGMIIVPCSMGTIGRIASGQSNNLIERCADVQLKENRPLIIVPRETPLNIIHLRNLTTLCESGARIVPAIPAWYGKPKTIDDLVNFMASKIFDSLGENLEISPRWNGINK